MRRHRLRPCSLAILVVAAAFLGCRSQPIDSPIDDAPVFDLPVDPADPSVLVYGRSKDSLTLDPAAASDGESAKVIDNVFETLIDFSDDPETPAEIVPNLAIDWAHSADRRAWTFTLRDGVRFHDGEPLDAEAVKFSLERLIRPDHPYAPERAPYRQSLARIREIQVTGRLGLRILLSEPSVVLIQNLAMFSASIVSPKAVKAAGKDFGNMPVGSGPYRVASHSRGMIVLERNEDWWVEDKPAIKTVVFVQIQDWDRRRELLKEGRIQVTDNVDVGDIDWLESTPGIDLRRVRGMNVCYLAMNNESPPLDNPDLRRAIALAVDRPRILRFGYADSGRVATDLLPSNVVGANHAILPSRNVEQARKIVAGLRAAAKQPLKLWYMKNQRPYLMNPSRVALIIRDCLQEIGLSVTLESFEWSRYLRMLRAGEHDLALMGWTSDNGDADNFYGTLLSQASIGETNYTRLRSPEFESLLAASREEEDPKTRLALFRRIQDVLRVECAVVPLVHTNVALACRSDVKGLQPHPIKLRLETATRQN